MTVIAQREAVMKAVQAVYEATVTPHPGLLLERGLEEQDNDEKKNDMLKHVADATPDVLYELAYKRRHAALERRAAHVVELYVQDRLIVGLGGEGVLETAITLHHAYGMPLIPGSALKGLARHYAEQVLAKQDSAESHKLDLNGEYHRILFGRQESAGYIIYHDAWYVPGTAPDNHPFARDVITVHHPQYYTKRGNERRPPWDFDDPNPVGFISARGAYLIAVEGSDDQWATFALGLLTQALADYGVGGKTAAGYGRLGLQPPIQPPAGPASPMPHTTTAPPQAAPSEPRSASKPSPVETAPTAHPREQSLSTPTPPRPPAPSGPTMAEITTMIAEIKALTREETREKLGRYEEKWQKIPPGSAFKEQRDTLARSIWERAKLTQYADLLQRPWARRISAYVDKLPKRK